MKRAILVMILLASLAAASWLFSHPAQATTPAETIDNCKEFPSMAVITITMTPVQSQLARRDSFFPPAALGNVM